MTTFVSSDPWRQQQTEAISDALQEFISTEGPSQAKECIRDAIMTWTDYHRQELAKWSALATSLNVRVD